MARTEKPANGRRGNVLDQIEGPELFIGLVGAVGTNLKLVSDVLSDELRKVRYEPHELRLSAVLAGVPKFNHLGTLKGGPEDVRVNTYMDAGDELRRTAKSGDALALLSVMAVRDHREQTQGDENKPIARRVYIFNSLKHPNEIRTLRQIYGR